MDQVKLKIKFQELNYYAKDGIFGQRYNKEILKNLNGEFFGSEFSAIMGPSGSGKSTLLNILSGYTTDNVSGTIQVNTKDGHDIRQKSSYIMQDYTLHHHITVHEAMKFSMNLKIGGSSKLTTNQDEKIKSILFMLGLDGKMETYSGNLSGGEQKRLSIALELVDDPQIMFFDEPTTGLDSSSSNQCFTFLKKLAQSGKAIVCSIHQPSALLFEMFDHLYALSEGQCIYQGSSRNLVPFLAELGLICPESYTPADYLLEIATNDYGPQNDRLIEKIENGKNTQYRIESTSVEAFSPFMNSIDYKVHHKSLTSFNNQLYHLLLRNFLITKRHRSNLMLRLGIHIFMGFFIGIMYLNTGQTASQILNIYKYLFFTIFILMFTAFSSLQTTFPLDIGVVKKEIFNRWYSSTAYYLALSVTDIPIIAVTNLLYILITYILTDQPMELFRFLAFLCTILMLSYSAQGLGLLAGSMLNVKFTLILGSFFLCPFVLFSNFFVKMKDTDSTWHLMFHFSFIKQALEGCTLAIFGFNRDKMSCDIDYCYYRWPHKFLESLGVQDTFCNVTMKLFAFIIIFRVLAFVIMSHRLKH